MFGFPVDMNYKHNIIELIQNKVKPEKRAYWLDLLEKQKFYIKDGALYWDNPDLRFAFIDVDFIVSTMFLLYKIPTDVFKHNTI